LFFLLTEAGGFRRYLILSNKNKWKPLLKYKENLKENQPSPPPLQRKKFIDLWNYSRKFKIREKSTAVNKKLPKLLDFRENDLCEYHLNSA
jgi:hypothetical protein